MKLAGKKQWILGIVGMLCGLVITGYFSIV
jgi:hypothetical protein